MLKVSIVLTLLITLSFKQPSGIQQDCYQKLKSELSKDWKLIADSEYYESKIIYEIHSIKSYRECIEQLDSAKVVQLFGLPNQFRQSGNPDNPGSTLEYNLTPPSTFSYPFTRWGALWIGLDSLNNVDTAWLFHNGILIKYE